MGGLVFCCHLAHALESFLCQRVHDVKYTAWDNVAHCLSMGLGICFLLDLLLAILPYHRVPLFSNLIRSSFASLSTLGTLHTSI